MDTASLYVTDVVSWAEAQVAELRRIAASSSTNAVDWENVIEEIESVGRYEWGGVRSQIVAALDHLLRAALDPAALSAKAWHAEIRVFLAEARGDYRPSMRQYLDMDAIWRRAVPRAEAALAHFDVAVPRGLPDRSPFQLDELLDPAFDPSAGVRRLQASIPKDPSGDIP